VGEFFAMLSAVFFGSANVLINKGIVNQGSASAVRDNGAFISILLTITISGLMVIVWAFYRGWPALNTTGIFWFGLAGILTAFIGRVFLYSSIQHLGPVRATTIKRLNPFFAVLIGVLLLGEPLTWMLVAGMILIFSSFIILMFEGHGPSFAGTDARAGDTPAVVAEKNCTKTLKESLRSVANVGYLYGSISALAYAFGYFGRKLGLAEIPDPFFGTMIGAAVGACVFLLIGVFEPRYRAVVRSTFTQFHWWFFLAGVASSVGQILYFTALNYSTISRVALISSMEVFFTIFLAVWVFKVRENLTPQVIAAAVVGIAGTALIVW
jgi:drug/metabolite transporter (DMT)-like permease